MPLFPHTQRYGVPEQPVSVTSMPVSLDEQPLDAVVVKNHVPAGQTLIDIPEKLVISLDRIFESEFVAELLTANKLSELAILTLYLMYEKKTGKDSFWSPFIKVCVTGMFVFTWQICSFFLCLLISLPGIRQATWTWCTGS